MQQDPGSVNVDPEVVLEGEEVEVKYDGDGTLFVQIDSGPWKEVPLDGRTGKGKVQAPPGARVMLFSDRKDRPSEAIVEIVTTEKP